MGKGRLISRKNKQTEVPEVRKREKPAVVAEENESCLTSYNAGRDLSLWDIKTGGKRTPSSKKVLGSITYGMMEEAIWTSGGLMTNIARKLNVSMYRIRGCFRKFPALAKMFEDYREALVDEVELHLMKKIREKGDTVAMIFMLKCLGKERGWSEAAGSGGKKAPVKVKIVPASSAKASNVVKFKKAVGNGKEK